MLYTKLQNCNHCPIMQQINFFLNYFPPLTISLCLTVKLENGK